MKYQDMLLAFRSLDDARRFDPESLTSTEQETWDQLRQRIERTVSESKRSPAMDNRRDLRVPTAQSVRYFSRNSSEDRWTADLGEGGLFLLDADPLPVGSRISMEIEGPLPEQTLHLKGEVVWSRPAGVSYNPGMGIRFTELDYSQKVGIRELIFERLSDAFVELN